MQFNQPFDARSIEPSQGPQPVPAGDYKVRIIASEPKPTKDNDGGYLELKLQILEGQYANREIIYRLNLFNKSQQAVEIAYRQLSALCHVTGVFNIQNSDQLHGIPFIAFIVIQTGGIYNEVKAVKDLAGNIPGKPGTAGVASAIPAAPAPAGWNQPPNAGFPQQAPATPAAPPPWAASAPAPQAAPQWGPPQPQAPAAAAPQPWSTPGAPPMQAAPPAAPAWGPPQPPAQAPMPPQAAAPPWAQQPQPTAAPPTWPPK